MSVNKSAQLESFSMNSKRTYLLPTKPLVSEMRSSPNNTTTNASRFINKSVQIKNTESSSNSFSSKNHTSLHNMTNKFSNNRSQSNRMSANISNITVDHSGLQTSISDTNYACQLCELNFRDLKMYNFHLVKIHKVDQRINLLQCYVNNCEQKFNRRMQLVDHLNNTHNLNIVVLNKNLHNLDEFTKWKQEIEQETGFKWIQNNKFFLNNRLRKTFICDRPATNGCKVYSLHGLTTINNHSTFCLSSIKITENQENTFDIEFIETHNHDEIALDA